MAAATRLLIVFAFLYANHVTHAQEKTEGSNQTQGSSQTEDSEIDTVKRADIIKMLKLTGADKMGMQAVKHMIAMQRQTNPNVPQEFWDDFQAEIKPDELIELAVPSYSKHLTHDDIKQLIKFYESPIGKKLTSVQPIIMQESMVAGQKWGMDLGRRIAERLQSEGFKP